MGRNAKLKQKRKVEPVKKTTTIHPLVQQELDDIASLLKTTGLTLQFITVSRTPTDIEAAQIYRWANSHGLVAAVFGGTPGGSAEAVIVISKEKEAIVEIARGVLSDD